jgi:hypothetical protein
MVRQRKPHSVLATRCHNPKGLPASDDPPTSGLARHNLRFCVQSGLTNDRDLAQRSIRVSPRPSSSLAPHFSPLVAEFARIPIAATSCRNSGEFRYEHDVPTDTAPRLSNWLFRLDSAKLHVCGFDEPSTRVQPPAIGTLRLFDSSFSYLLLNECKLMGAILGIEQQP